MSDGRGRPLRLRHLANVSLLVAAGALLTNCSGTSAGALAHEACLHVASSVRDYERAAHAPNAQQLRARAANELRLALRPAALAASESTDYQALAATLSESSRVPESELIQALNDQCAASLAGE